MEKELENQHKISDIKPRPFKCFDALKWILIGLTQFLIIILAFGVGVSIGSMKAKFSYKWAENYNRNFAGPPRGFFDELKNFPDNSDFIEGHGVFGEIIALNQTGFIIKGKNNVEKMIIVSKDTIVKKGRETINNNELKIGNRVVVIGEPNEKGQIEAKLIRFFSINLMQKQGLKPFPPLL